jgi:hypothetical protein
VLARLDQIEGVEKSFANRTGTMLRVSLAPSADRDKVAEAIRGIMTRENRKPVFLAGNELEQALVKEEWGSPGELSAIEFRTLALRRVKTFAEAEKFDKEATDRLVKIAEQLGDRIVKATAAGVKQPADWRAGYGQFATAVADLARELLSAEQVERLKEALTSPFRGETRPEALCKGR